MNDTEYHQLVDAEWLRIEEAIDDCGADIDYEIIGNVMNLEFDDKSQIVINKQEPMQQIWLASKSGGFHFSYVDEKWICSKTGSEFFLFVKQECDKHSGEAIEWC